MPASTRGFAALTGFRALDVVHLGPPRADEGFTKPTASFDARHDQTVRRLTFGAAGFVRFSGVDATFSVGPESLAELLRVPVQDGDR